MVLVPSLLFSSPLTKNDFGERLLLKWILLLETVRWREWHMLIAFSKLASDFLGLQSLWQVCNLKLLSLNEIVIPGCCSGS